MRTGYQALDEAQRDLMPGCVVRRHGLVRSTAGEIEELRKDLGERLSNRLVRQADEQTVVGMAAVLDVIGDDASLEHFHRWGIVAAPRFLGRLPTAAVFDRYGRKGVAAMSPSFVPQYSLHSVAGGISVALGFHGPSLGVGGGPCSVREGLLVAASLTGQSELPGAWLVLTEWEADSSAPTAADHGARADGCMGLAVALAARDADAEAVTGEPNAGGTSSRTPALLSENSGVAEFAAMLDASLQAAHAQRAVAPEAWPDRNAA